LVVAVVFAASCGGSESASTAEKASLSRPRTTKKAFIAKANAICKQMEADFKALPDLSGERDLEVLASALDEALGIYRTGLRELRNLDVPSGHEARVEAVWTAHSLIAGDFRDLAQAVREGDVAELDRLDAKLDRDGDAADALARTYGFTACAE
jgi:hypothetical protein